MKQLIALCLLAFLSAPAFAEDGFTCLMPEKSGLTWTKDGQAQFGWVKYGGDATFEFDGEKITGRRGPGHNTFLCTEKKYMNFVFKCEMKFEVDCNSGIQFRSNVRKQQQGDNEISVVYGYQYELATTGNSGKVYDEGRRGVWIDAPEEQEASEKGKKLFNATDWNEVEIQCVGPSIKTWVNGEKIADFVDILCDDGFFGLQVHAGNQGVVHWRNIRVKELPATPWISLYSNKTYGPVEEKPSGKWEIQEDGSLLGTTPSGEARDGMFLSKDVYKDFAVKVSFKEIGGNSGLYFRATEVDKPYWLRGFQCEIADLNACCNLWEVEGRGWVAKTPETEAAVAKVLKPKQWNDVGTVAIGDHIVTFLNGQKIVDVIDPKCAKEGKTGLQLHGGGDQGYYFQEYWIMPLDADAVKLINER
ncbi:MAG: DUF1080 domain-containing protein [Planctomycetaceae bacterium]|nr:DUF1080 domain-containing protein [Planctomycetaceae bacterium]